MDHMVEARLRRMEAALASGERDAFNRVFLWRLEGMVHERTPCLRAYTGAHLR